MDDGSISDKNEIEKYQKEIKRIKVVIIFLLIPFLLYIIIIVFRYFALTTSEYYTNTSIAKNLGIIWFMLIVISGGICLFLWRNSNQQFWYGATEVIGSLLYTFYYLDEETSLPYINWLTAFYFCVRGFQNMSDGFKKNFEFKEMVLTLLSLGINLSEGIFNVIRINKKR
ncbi:hypothetical protein [Dyadobacter sediminis]|uniref:Uncharacterized protein n=1 Tax=Dyadobacter sediminis TaxID=1493691 RepID=A0A5R9K5Q1_9BACT|nr:hypothetical protein [Dyadobacter sediminis]TLU88982.1 hypothetical protein FEM55_23110 [Dyadobacter sediminis]GGC15905.1 hypothetical protein GCM10011325_48390 [Dyadobacter sediminis]